MIIADQLPELDELRLRLEQVSVADLVSQITPGVGQANPQGTVHAKSVYSAVNIARRSPPGPIFYALLANRPLP